MDRSTKSIVFVVLAAIVATVVIVTLSVTNKNRDQGRPATDKPSLSSSGATATDQRPDKSEKLARNPQSTGSEVTNHPPGFQDVVAESGIDFLMQFLPAEQGETFKLNLYDHGCGVVIGDYDGDGHDDVYFLNQLGANALYKNRGNGTFVDATQEAGVGLGDRICVGAVFGDCDNDGDQDLYVTSTRGGNVFFQNDGDGHFKDVTEEAGLTLVAHSQTAAFVDLDNDGYLDLVVTNSAQWTTDSFDQAAHYFRGPERLFDLFASPKEYNVVYHNNRDGTFSNVTDSSGLKGLGWGGDVAIADFDEDGLIDIVVTNMFGLSQLYRNEGSGRFKDVTKETLKRTSWGAIGSKFFDFDNDGRLDLFIVDMHSDMWTPVDYDAKLVEWIRQNEGAKYRLVTGPRSQFDQNYVQIEQQFVDRFKIRYDDFLFGNSLFKNLGGGKFEEISDRANMETLWPWGIAPGDFDNDGYEDVYLPCGMGYPWFYWRSYLMMNNRGETFTDRSTTEGIEPPARGRFQEKKIAGRAAPRSSRCAAVADFDGDGRLDIMVNNFNDQPYYYKNGFTPKNYIAFRLRGTTSNLDAVGTLVKCYVGAEVLTRQVHAAGGYLSQSSKTVHFGLGDRSKIDRVEIRWPSGTRQEIENPELNVLHEVTEPK